MGWASVPTDTMVLDTTALCPPAVYTCTCTPGQTPAEAGVQVGEERPSPPGCMGSSISAKDPSLAKRGLSEGTETQCEGLGQQQEG